MQVVSTVMYSDVSNLVSIFALYFDLCPCQLPLQRLFHYNRHRLASNKLQTRT